MSNSQWTVSATWKAIGIAAVAAFGAMMTDAAMGAEEGKSVYLLGSNGPMAGFVPPPGTYLSSINYLYRGDASGAVAASRGFRGRTGVEVSADLDIEARVTLTAKTLLWVAPQQVMGGFVGLGVIVPVGYQEASIDIDAKVAITLPNGQILGANRQARLSDETYAFGDPLAMAFVGWHHGNWHSKLTALLNIPVGAYDEANIVNMGFNRWAADLSGAATWLDPARGHEVSLAAGFTFNGENPDTDYRTGTEFHVEAALMQHLSPAFALGVVGYHYQQVSGDSGAGAVLGAFKGEVTAVGPNFNYNFQLGALPVSTTLRWLHEWEAKNRLKGDAAYLTVTVPLGGAAK